MTPALFCAAFSFITTQLPLVAAGLRRSTSAGARGRWEVGGRVVGSAAGVTAAGAGRAGIAAGTRAAPGRTTAEVGLWTTSRRPRKALEWAEGRAWVAAEFAAPVLTTDDITTDGSDARQ